MQLIRLPLKLYRYIFYKIDIVFSWNITWLRFKLNGVQFYNDFQANGRPRVNVNLKGKFSIGKGFVINNGKHYNVIGRQQQCYFVVGPSAELTIGENVGISSAAIICWNNIIIGNNVKVGGNSVIYDTDFHSLDAKSRIGMDKDKSLVKTKPVRIHDNVFLGAHSIVLKGVTIGENSIIGAGSVVTKDIPKNQIWAGNPARFIRNIVE